MGSFDLIISVYYLASSDANNDALVNRR